MIEKKLYERGFASHVCKSDMPVLVVPADTVIKPACPYIGIITVAIFLCDAITGNGSGIPAALHV